MLQIFSNIWNARQNKSNHVHLSVWLGSNSNIPFSFDHRPNRQDIILNVKVLMIAPQEDTFIFPVHSAIGHIFNSMIIKKKHFHFNDLGCENQRTSLTAVRYGFTVVSSIRLVQLY